MKTNLMASEKKKIVILLDWYLPGNKAGGPVRSIYSLCELLKDSFNITIVTSNSDLGSNDTYKNVQADTLFEKDGIQYYYLSKKNLHGQTVVKLINSFNPSLVYLNSFWSYPFSIAIARAKQKNQLKADLILAPRGMLNTGSLGLKSFKKKLYLLVAKLFHYYDNVTFHATNEKEKIDILSQFKKNPVVIAENLNSGKVYHHPRIKEINSLKLFFLSRIAEVKNLHYALDLLRSIPETIRIEYAIFGNEENSDYWQVCESILHKLPPTIKVRKLGEISFTNIQKTISEYHALLLPTLNENYGHSIVESLLTGCPVIISDQTPWNDLENFGAGYAVPLHQKEKFIAAIINMAEMDQGAFDLASKKAIEYISNKIDLKLILQQYKILFDA